MNEQGADVLNAVEAFLRRFVAFPSDGAAVATVLWAAHTHVVQSFTSTPRLAVLSPEPGSGKTRLLEVLELLVQAPLSVFAASVAAVFRVIEKESPTLLFDEVDAVFSNKGSDSSEDLRALLNAGHRKGAQVPRVVGKQMDVHLFAVYTPVAMAGLGDLPDTLMSRSVILRMRRRAPDEVVQSFRRREVEPTGDALKADLCSWTTSVADLLSAAYPLMPDGVTDRPADVWEPLLAVADAAGGDWPTRARNACVELNRIAGTRDASLGVRLLTDLRVVFTDDRVLSTEDILGRLGKLDEAPWATLRGEGLDPRGLARLLGGYGITSTKVKIGDRSVRGYRREDLWDAWTRYLVVPPENAEPAEPPEPRSSDSTLQVPQLQEDIPQPRWQLLLGARDRALADGVIAHGDPTPREYLMAVGL